MGDIKQIGSSIMPEALQALVVKGSPMVNSNSSARKGQSKTPQGTRRSSRPRTASQLRPVGNRTPTPYHHGALTPQSMERVDIVDPPRDHAPSRRCRVGTPKRARI